MLFTNKKQVFVAIVRYLGIALLFATAAAVAILFISRSIVKIGDSLAQKEELSRILSNRVENAQHLEEALKIIGNNDQKIQEAYLPADNILDFVSALESIANQNSLQQSLRFTEPVPFSDATDIPKAKTDFTITLNGTIITLKSYLQQLELLPFMAKVNMVNLLAAPPSGWEGNSAITINGTLYVRQNR